MCSAIHQFASSALSSDLPASALSSLLRSGQGHTTSHRRRHQGPASGPCQPSAALSGERHARNSPDAWPAPSAAPDPTPYLPASRRVAPGISSLLAEDNMTDGDRDISQSTRPDLKSLISPRAAKLSYVRFQPLCSQAGLAGQNCLPHGALKETTSQHQFPMHSNGQGGLCPVCGILGPDPWCQDTCH